jgi:hypothetical protein
MTNTNFLLLHDLIYQGMDDTLKGWKERIEDGQKLAPLFDEDNEILAIIDSYLSTNFDGLIRDKAREEEEDGFHTIKIDGEYPFFDVEAEVHLTTTIDRGDNHLTPDSVKTKVDILDKTITLLKE